MVLNLLLDGPTKQVIEEIGADIVRFARHNIKSLRKYKTSAGRTYKKRINYSGALAKGLFFEVNVTANSIEMIAGAKGKAAKYIDVVDGGRRKGKGVPAGILERWVEKKLNLRDPITGRFQKKTAANIQDAANRINRKIKLKGIPATNFMRDAVTESFELHEDELEETVLTSVDLAVRVIMKNLQEQGKLSRIEIKI